MQSSERPTRNLICLLIAEGHISQKDNIINNNHPARLTIVLVSVVLHFDPSSMLFPQYFRTALYCTTHVLP